MVSGRYIELVTVYNVVKLNQFEYPLVTTYWYGLIIPAQRVHVIIVLLREKHEVLGGTGKKKYDSHPKKSAEKSILPKNIYIKITPRFTVRFFLGGLQHLFIEPSIAGCFAQFDTLQDDPP